MEVTGAQQLSGNRRRPRRPQRSLHRRCPLGEDVLVSESPAALQRLDSMLAEATIAHEAIFELHRRLLVRERGGNESAELVAESARIATVRLPALAVPLRGLLTRWPEESVLDQYAAASTAREAAAQLAAVEPEMRSLLARQSEIAARLRALLA
jgi:hypothetical protein